MVRGLPFTTITELMKLRSPHTRINYGMVLYEMARKPTTTLTTKVSASLLASAKRCAKGMDLSLSADRW